LTASALLGYDVTVLQSQGWAATFGLKKDIKGELEMVRTTTKTNLMRAAILSSLAFGSLVLAQVASATEFTGQNAAIIAQALRGLPNSPLSVAEVTCMWWYDLSDTSWKSGCNFFYSNGKAIGGLQDEPNHPSAKNFMRALGAQPGSDFCSVNSGAVSCSEDGATCEIMNLIKGC
jgi:hypothetical protein